MSRPSPGARVSLVSLPFSTLQHPSLGLSLLATRLREDGYDCGIDYFSFDFAKTIGLDSYALLTDEKFYQSFLGEWIFSSLVFPRSDELDFAYFNDVLSHYAGSLEYLLLMGDAIRARQAASDFIDRCVDRIASQNPAIIGISTSFQQTAASLAFARRIRSRLKDCWLVFGGANCESELGRNLLRNHPEIDAVCLGEGDDAFPEFVRRVFSEEPVAELDGVVTRNDPHDAPLSQPRLVTDLDALPIPDFSDFYEQHGQISELRDISPAVPTVETSRGCWWGAKHHCTFCGLNGLSMAFRRKSADRVFHEFNFLADRHGPDFVVVDNILDHRFFEELLPRFVEDDREFLMHFEVKANLTWDQVSALSRTGIRKIQPGIESLSTDVLKSMRKGTTRIRNIQILKLCAEAGIYVDWSHLYGFPGETAAQYAAIVHVIPHLRHLQAPAGCNRVRADRFSPYFNDPESFGVEIRPNSAYPYIYSGDGVRVDDYAYHYDIVNPAKDAALDQAVEAMKTAIIRWQSEQETSLLYFADGAQSRVVDQRRGDVAVHALGPLETAILAACPSISSFEKIAKCAHVNMDDGDYRDAVASLANRGLLIVEGNAVLCLVLRMPGFRTAPNWDEIRTRSVIPYSVFADAQT
ncbi:RiPP maturation radical SAM C-methyltransferase [Hoeflea sp. WL0058]|uniref:RiPP maturation radical SAM C-methyltransferase n=1 Tax=Flavimaribacter sediminis TaxID=2865987 RepID=A0AAE3CZJ4_9HYPH|nr:RiPP maturation radical SAM C-methyltransferase [Flavimaribacter sediminis]MBW8636022.1 RiPP maturation radical SAM C-methyltransferase [Flavimaribacter sediminis]